MRTSFAANIIGLRVTRRARAAVAWIACAAFVACGLGVLPSLERLAGVLRMTEGSDRFPCEGCACGCGTAEHCWTQCCCHSLDQRLAWAEANGVALPRAVALLAFARFQQRDREASLPACCRASDQHACCAPARRLPSMSSLACKGVAGWLVPCTMPPVAPSSVMRVCLDSNDGRFAPALGVLAPIGPPIQPPHSPPRS